MSGGQWCLGQSASGWQPFDQPPARSWRCEYLNAKTKQEKSNGEDGEDQSKWVTETQRDEPLAKVILLFQKIDSEPNSASDRAIILKQTAPSRSTKDSDLEYVPALTAYAHNISPCKLKWHRPCTIDHSQRWFASGRRSSKDPPKPKSKPSGQIAKRYKGNEQHDLMAQLLIT